MLSLAGVLGTKVSPPLKGGETYLFIYQTITVVFVIKIFLKLTDMGQRADQSESLRIS